MNYFSNNQCLYERKRNLDKVSVNSVTHKNILESVCLLVDLRD